MARPIVPSLNDIEFFAVFEDDRYVYHEFTYWTPDNEAWYGTVTKDPTEDPTLEEINKHLERVEEVYMYPEPSSTMTIADPTLANVFIKRPHCPSPSDGDLMQRSKTFLHEISIMERIPAHPNIVKYYGCCIRRGRVIGIVMERLGQTLKQSPLVANIPAFLEELQSAVDHLHLLGLAHNDINPNNIMLKGDHPVLIDFGGCAPVGQNTDFAGTEGWTEKSSGISQKEHDTYAMKKLRTWLTDTASS